MAATWLARFPGLKVRFVEKRDGKIFAGQADGIQCRTLEVFESFGFADRVWKDANHMLEVRSITPNPLCAPCRGVVQFANLKTLDFLLEPRRVRKRCRPNRPHP